MTGKWLQDIIQQWRQNPRLRYAALLVVVILSMHGILKLADHRDEIVKEWSRDQELKGRLSAVSNAPEWLKRGASARANWRAQVLSLPRAETLGQAKAEQAVWLAEFARQTKLLEPQVKIEDALEVPDRPGLLQVVSRLEGKGQPWELREPLRRLAQALPWRQVERVDVVAVEGGGTLTAIIRSYYRTGDFAVPAASVSSKAPPTAAEPASPAPASGSAAVTAAAPTGGTQATAPATAIPATPATPATSREPAGKGMVKPTADPAKGVLQEVLAEPGAAPSSPEQRRK